ncbi:5-deoxy-glucuronate isomerase [Aquiluna sp.]|nr:5-deoxy-glucuronate isomerase [Aquiluna sp.]MDA8992854.1 5-deoxy-glucuronate isomerase [Aquiluna sp.]
MKWFYRQGRLHNGPFETVVDGRIPSWRHTGLRVASLKQGIVAALSAINLERIVVPLNGSFVVEYTVDGQTHKQTMKGRQSPFHGTTDTLYLPLGVTASITGVGRVAIAEGPATKVKKVIYSKASDVPIELRGAGQATRQVHNFGTPQALDADRLIVCEVITPAGNWSSYPPHKHDEYVPGVQSNLEEIYYFEVANARGSNGPRETEPIGYFRNYGTDAKKIDTLVEVRTGDVALVPHGWHGPAMAAPGYDLYYLNVMAGPDPHRSWDIVDDPHHGWVRGAWTEQELDPRLPYTSQE